MNVLIPLAGLGSRFLQSGNSTPKPLIMVDNLSLIEHSINSFNIKANFIFITREYDNNDFNIKLSNLLKKIRPESQEIRLKSLTTGASETALAAKHLINNNIPLVIYNCDQKLIWDPSDFLNFVKDEDAASALVLFKSSDPKNSFAEVVNGKVIRTVEKNPISSHALVGFHYWRSGSYFVKSAELLLKSFRSEGRPECYISETFNFLHGLDVLPFHIQNSSYIPLGTPEDVARYLGKSREYVAGKTKTLFIDLDGTILKHAHSISSALESSPILLPGVREKLNEWDSSGYKIILVTARKESTRQKTQNQLQELGVAWDYLIMGVGTGERILINDKLTTDSNDRAISLNVITDIGFNTISWSDYGL